MSDPYAGSENADDMSAETEGEEAADNRPAALKLSELLAVPNIVEMLTDEQRVEIAHKALEGYRLDDASRTDWKERTKEAMDLAMLLTGDAKNYPFKGASNIKYPLLTTAALQFNARAYPAIIQGDRVAKCKVNGTDGDGAKAKRGERVSEHLSYQLTSEMPEWEEDTDRLLMIVSIAGCVFRKVYYDPTLGRKCSRLVTADRLVINYRARSLEDVPRISEEMMLYPYEIEERIRDGRFIDFEYGDAKPDANDDNSTGQTDDYAPHKFIEQHRLIDLDGDDYPEPYIVTVHIDTEKVCRIVPNFTQETVRVTQDGKIAAIRRQDYYTKYMFLPSPDGGAYGMGLGWLLLSTNEAINTTMNEMLDAGHLSNVQGGFISSQAGIREKKISLERGQWKVITSNMPMNQAIMPIKYDGPSPTLFNLLGLLIEQGKEVSLTKDVLTGDTGGKVMQPTTVLALIEQGKVVFNAIFKRIHRAAKHELQLHARINHEHLTPEAYNAFWDDPAQEFDPKADYDLKDMNIGPVSDPTVSSDMQRLTQSQIIAEIAANNPMVNQEEATRRRFDAARIPDIDKLMVKPPEPDPKQAAFMEAMQKMTLQEMVAKIGKMHTAQLLDVANAEAAEVGNQLSVYDGFLRTLQAEHGMEMDNAQQAAGGSGQLPGMAGAPGDQMGAGGPEAQGGLGQDPAAGPALQPTGGQPGSPTDGSAVSAPQGAM